MNKFNIYKTVIRDNRDSKDALSKVILADGRNPDDYIFLTEKSYGKVEGCSIYFMRAYPKELAKYSIKGFPMITTVEEAVAAIEKAGYFIKQNDSYNEMFDEVNWSIFENADSVPFTIIDDSVFHAEELIEFARICNLKAFL